MQAVFLSSLLLMVLGSAAHATEFDELNAEVAQYRSSQAYQQQRLADQRESDARQTRGYNSKILKEANAFAKYHGGSVGPLSVSYSSMGVVETIDLSTRDGLSNRCIYYAYRLTCESIDKRTLEKRKVEFRGAYGIEKRVD